MKQFNRGTFNTLIGESVEIGGDFPVWARVRDVYQGGGQIDITKFAPGTLIGAGTPVVFNGPGKEVRIVAGSAHSATEKYKMGQVVKQNGKYYEANQEISVPEAFSSAKWTDITSKVNGFVLNDVLITESTKTATCAVVRSGRIYADRVRGAEILPEMEANTKQTIEFTREG